MALSPNNFPAAVKLINRLQQENKKLQQEKEQLQEKLKTALRGRSQINPHLTEEQKNVS